MKKYLIYILILIAGLALGYVFFSSDGNPDKEKKETAQKSQTYTCSMHPQIRKQEPGDCPICGMELIPVKQSGGSQVMGDAIKMSPRAMALAGVQTTTVGQDSVSSSELMLSGKIKPNENASSVQAAYFDGRLEQLFIEFEGEKINRGQLLAKIYAPKLVSAQQELLTVAKNKESQPELYQAVRNKLKNWKISEGQIDKIESSGKVLRNFPIYANSSGIVIEKNVSEGDYVKEGQTLYQIANLDQVWAVFDAYENQIGQLQENQNIEITANSYPAKTWKSKISFIQPILNESQRTVKVRAELDNSDQMLKPGMFIKGAVKTKSSGNKTLSVPKTAVLWTGERSVVYVQAQDGTPIFELREVQLGTENQNGYQIIDGLKSGEKVVTQGTFTVDAAAQLQGKNSMMSDKQSEKDFSAEFSGQFEEVIDHYFNLKDALVASDAVKTSSFAKKAKTELTQLKNSPQAAKTNINQLDEAFSKIENTDTIKQQRQYFIALSEAMIKITGQLSLKDSLFIQKCPMAKNQEGARWISREKEIRNPYFGEKMLKCGSVVDLIK
jgi:Cu(I)/Ag(I) efflux system membrane fusion protein